MAKKKTVLWETLPKEDLKRIVRSLLQARYSREAVGAALGTTKNAIVGYQHRHLSDLTGVAAGITQGVPDDILASLLAAGTAQKELPESITEGAGPESKSCEWPLTTSKSLGSVATCNKPVVPGLKCCEEHAPLVYPRYRKNKR